MDNQEHFNETEYIKGFNQGYTVTKNFPEFSELLKSATGKSDLLDGMKDGREQFLDEELNKKMDRSEVRSKQNLPEFLKRDQFEDKIDTDRDIDIEPER